MFNPFYTDSKNKKRDGIASGLKPNSDRSTQNKHGQNGPIKEKVGLQKRMEPMKRIIELKHEIDELRKKKNMRFHTV